MARIELAPLPHREAIEYLQSKGYAHELQRFHHLDHFREDHARNWVVAKAMQDDVSRAIREAVESALIEGRPLADFQQDLAPRLQRMGWWGKAEMEDPVTGQTELVQLGSMHRLRTIFDTNMRTAHAAGHWAAIQRTKTAFPYLHYIQIQRPTKRHDHARFHDRIWHVDDPIWLKIYPPNGYFCGCIALQRTEGWMRRNARTVDEALDLEEEEWVHKRSGEVHRVPAGIQPGFDTNPGAVWLDIKRDWDEMTPDLTPERRATERGLIEGLRLHRLSDGRETLIITDADSQPVAMRTADPESPNLVSFKDIDLPPAPSFLHSHVNETSLSIEDIRSLHEEGGSAITAISPGGSIWRATRGQEPPRRAIAEFHMRALPGHRTELEALSPEHGRSIYQHALMLWLERRGVITYSYRVSERNRQLFDRYADLIGSLTDDRLLPDA
ncbi:phage head morphogenesis protein [Paracoccus denitrificans]|uniref:phage head morphogenesis protein n=1 Tax=Paracoccus denitrificans TaxID=266 RepID=UPI001E3D5A78|nr:phage minor head protein [Paracoccus denitrificans]UFS63833.1 phage head morphogenesis protein [Paracoccus denitrificans]